MSIFDRLKQSAVDAAATAATAIGNKREPLPLRPSLRALPSCRLSRRQPFDTLSGGGVDRAGPVRLCR